MLIGVLNNLYLDKNLLDVFAVVGGVIQLILKFDISIGYYEWRKDCQ